jgi:hypothetical protein
MEKARQRGLCCRNETKRVKYLLETLEPEGIDSFSIGIFSIRCYSKEGYSSYVFEDTAAQILKPET